MRLLGRIEEIIGIKYVLLIIICVLDENFVGIVLYLLINIFE